MCQIYRQAITSANIIFRLYKGAVAILQDSGKDNIIMFLKSLSLIFDPRALASNHLVHILMMNWVKLIYSK